uniref:Bulb-type lectin domain-containing protein n=1 Tax=Vitis vinifera TaxID=29760 RepID=F6GZX4_VITVI
MDRTVGFFVLVLLLTCYPSSSETYDTLSEGSSLSVEKSNDVLISANGIFSAGFYQVGNNTFCFAIWFTKSWGATTVWMANHDQPVNGRGSKLSLLRNGNLILTDAGKIMVWMINTDIMPPRRTTSSQNSQANDDVPPIEGLPPVSAEGIYRYLGTLVGLVERQARAVGTNVQGQSSSSRGSSFDDFKKLGPPYFSGATDPTEAEAWILKMEKFFGVIDCSEEQKASYAAFMLDKETDHWWRMTKRLLEDQGPITWRQFREAFYKKYFPDSVRWQKVGEFIRLEQRDMTVAQYEAKFTKLSRFSPQLIAIEEEKALKFQDGLKPYLKNKISILKLGVYSEVVDRALITEKDNEELHQYREQQRKRNRSDGAHGNQAQRRSTSGRNQNKGKAAQNLDGACPTCGKKHGGRPCYRETGACFGCGKQGHLIRE